MQKSHWQTLDTLIICYLYLLGMLYNILKSMRRKIFFTVFFSPPFKVNCMHEKIRRQIKEGFLRLKTIETWIMCVPFRGGKIFKCFWKGCGSRCQAHRFVSRTVTLLDFSFSTVSRVYQEWSTTQRTSSQVDTTVASRWASIPMKCFWHLVESIAHRIETVLRAKGKVILYVLYTQCITHCLSGISITTVL